MSNLIYNIINTTTISFDAVLEKIAPHQCVVCGVEGSVLCPACISTAGEPITPRCVGCYKLSDDSKTCSSCRSWMPAHSVFIATSFEGIYERLLKTFKFDLKRQAVKPIARMMAEATPLRDYDFICPLPTAPSRVRERGFDHTKLIARELARLSKITYRSVLNRHSNVRQVGANRTQRLKQMEDEFYVSDPSKVKDKSILLVDDITTTGASIASAAKTLKKAGAKRVYVSLFAQKL